MSNSYGLIGYPLSHSFSSLFFKEKFADEGIDAIYQNFPLEKIDKLEDIIREYSINGFNVTIPYKEKIFQYLDYVDKKALDIGAVNVVKVCRDSLHRPVLYGFNSDFYGFRESLRPILVDNIESALVLGTGGASKAVAFGLKELGIDTVFVSRNPAYGEIGYSQLTDEVMSRNKLIINTTPLGMYPHVQTCPDIPYHKITRFHICYDLIYNPSETLFLRKSREHNSIIKNGYDMLILQALESWRIWNSPIPSSMVKCYR